MSEDVFFSKVISFRLLVEAFGFGVQTGSVKSRNAFGQIRSVSRNLGYKAS